MGLSLKTTTTAVLLLFSLAFGFSQGEANNWYFGQNAGVSFNSGAPVALTDGQLNTLEGCSSISTTAGQLQFYTDGRTVWNRNHAVMLNGTGLRGDESSTSSGLIVPQPGNPNVYFIFTVDEPHHDNADGDPGTVDGDGVNDGLMYSVVDMSLDGGLGGIIVGQKNIQLITYNTADPFESALKCSEKITAVKSDDCDSFWLITHFKDSFYSFSIDATGVNPTPVISTVGPEVPLNGYRRNALGYLKASPDGTKIGVCHFGFATALGTNGPGKIMLHDFDDATGIVSNSTELFNGDSPYGIEFSPEGRKLYATLSVGDAGNGNGQLLQYDLEAADIPASQLLIDNSSLYSAGALQLGPDGRIYRALFSFSTGQDDFLGVINDPEANGALANYNENGVFVGVGGTRGSRIGLPPFIQSIFSTRADIIGDMDAPGDGENVLSLCTGDTYTLVADNIPGATYTWTQDGNPLAETDFDLLVTQTGTYIVEIDPNNGDCPIIGEAIVTVYDFPAPTAPSDFELCDIGNDGVETFNLVTNVTPQLSVDTIVFNVTYHTSPTRDDTDLITNPGVYQNTSPTETLYIKIANNGNTNCDDRTLEVNLALFANPEPMNLTDPYRVCDDASNDGLADFNLIANVTPLLGIDETVFDITYHTDPARDPASQIADPANYNGQPSQNVFIKVTNPLNAICTDEMIQIGLIVDPAPGLTPIALNPNDRLIEQCDNDNDNVANFNLDEAYDLIVTDGVPDYTITFHTSQADAIANAGPIGPIYQNGTPTEEIWVRAVSDQGCENISNFFIRAVGANLGDVPPMVSCEDDDMVVGDGNGLFDLVQKEIDIRNDFGLDATISLRFYPTLLDAELELNEILQVADYISPQTNIWVRAEGGTGNCQGIEQVALIVNDLPQPVVEPEYIICFNEIGNDSITIDPGTFDGYLWVNEDTGETIGTSQFITISQSGNYSITATNIENGLACDHTENFTVLTSNIPQFADPAFTVVDGQTLDNSITVNLLFNTGDLTDPDDYEYALDDPSGPYQTSNVFQNLVPGIYTVYVRNINGNCAINSRMVSVIGFPKFFTPNNDSFNDTWNVLGVSAQFQAGSSIYIFDRFGKLLKQVSPSGPGWDGTYNGSPLPSSDYWFRVQLEDGREFKGHFTLKR